MDARIIAAVATQIQSYDDSAAIGGETYTLDNARQRNAEGWDVEVPSTDRAAASRGTWVRHEGLVLSDADLQRAYGIAMSRP